MVWIFIGISWLALVFYDIIEYKWIAAAINKDDNDDNERAIRLSKSINYLHGIQSSTNSVAHWIFAIEYFRIALIFPIIIELYQPNVNEKLEKAKRIVYWANCLFYALLLVWLILIFSINFEKYKYAFIVDASGKVISAGILVYSIISLKHSINKVKRPDFFARERLMHIHTFLFISYVIFYIIGLSLDSYHIHYYN